ncbi:hypothetical protein GA0061083_2874 [Pseudarthrobacter enclensis]|nr:hypothetical protein GA0061083_2874 [Pseudarthrobacter enclensis]
MEFTLAELRAAGFRGFVPFSALERHRSELSSPGVYVVIRPEPSALVLRDSSTGFWYRGKNPAYPLTKLRHKWELPTPMLYIGKAGAINGGTTLWERLDLYRRYGAGENTTHRGGRAIWQIEDAANQLLVGWSKTPGLNPECVEERLLELFDVTFDMLPMANQRRGTKCKHQPRCDWNGG